MLVLIIETTKSQRIICATGKDCIIDCSNVNGMACSDFGIDPWIDALEATSLTVLCDEENSCKNTKIYTPKSIDSTTIVECSASNSCSDTEIYYSGNATSSASTHSIKLTCSPDACTGIEGDVSNAGTLPYNSVDICQNKCNTRFI